LCEYLVGRFVQPFSFPAQRPVKLNEYLTPSLCSRVNQDLKLRIHRKAMRCSNITTGTRRVVYGNNERFISTQKSWNDLTKVNRAILRRLQTLEMENQRLCALRPCAETAAKLREITPEEPEHQ
jgi:hypothetical protein